MVVYRTLLQEGWNDTEESKEKLVLDDSNGLSWEFESMSFKLLYELSMVNLSLEWWKEHLKLFYKALSINPCLNR